MHPIRMDAEIVPVISRFTDYAYLIPDLIHFEWKFLWMDAIHKDQPRDSFLKALIIKTSSVSD